MGTYYCKLRTRVILIILTIAMISFAFIHSSMPSVASDEESLAVLGFFQKILNNFNLGDKLTNHMIRKLAHYTEYTIIGSLLTSTAFSFDKLKFYRYTTTIGFVGLASAVADEFIQLHIEGRAGLITDVLIDFSGVCTGFFVFSIIFTIYKKAFIKNNLKK